MSSTSLGQKAFGIAALIGVALLPLSACDGALRFDELEVDGGTDATSDAGSLSDGRASACSVDASCSRGLHCDATLRKCFECVSDGHCNSSRAHCDLGTHQCVECLVSTDCGEKRTCVTSTHRCVDACEHDNDPCPIAGQVCHDDQRMCVECFRDNQCGGTPERPRCDSAIGRCVACRGSADCGVASPACDRRDGACVECLDSSWCSGSRSVCDPATRTCVE